jgi:NAD(P)-dependent dehydrogenase (short-subunit alcohol dehydrogenase family)
MKEPTPDQRSSPTRATDERTGSFSISGMRTVITGGTAGIGLGVAEYFVASAARVVITGRRDNGQDVAMSIGARFVTMDVTDTTSVDAGMTAAADYLGGGIDSLILNAGIDLPTGPVDDLDLEAFERVIDVNLLGVTRGLAAGLRHMGPGSTVIVTSSPAGRVTSPGMAAYSASKAATDMLVRVASIDLGVKGIRVNAVLPGIVESEMSGGSTGDGSAIRMFTQTGVIRRADEMGGVYRFLASSASAPLTGATVQADDGISAGPSIALMEAAFGGHSLEG